MTTAQMQIESAAKGATMDEEMGWLTDNFSWGGEEVMEHIFRATIILKQLHPHRTLGECLRTALIWECG